MQISLFTYFVGMYLFIFGFHIWMHLYVEHNLPPNLNKIALLLSALV